MTKGWVQWATATAFWVVIAVLYGLQIWALASMPGEQIRFQTVLVWQSVFYLGWIPFTVLIWRQTPRWDPARVGWVPFLLGHAAAAVAIAVVHATLVALVAPLLAPPEPTGPESLWQVVSGQLRARIWMQVIIYAGIVSLGQATALHARWRDRDAQAAALQAQLTAARLEALRAQLQPHFLFNSLHVVASLVRDGRNAEAVRLISGLSDLLRRVLDQGDADVPLAEELALVSRYVEIQQARFGDRLQVTIDVEPGLDAMRVPALTIQPLVENAVRHGLASRPSAGRIELRVRRDAAAAAGSGDGASLVIEVRDDGVGLPADFRMGNGAGTGLRNLAARLQAKYDGRAALELTSGEGGGVLARVTMPAEAG